MGGITKSRWYFTSADNLSQSLRHGETGGIGLYLSTANFLVTKQIGLGLATSVEQTLADYTERFGKVSDFSPALSVHQIPLFNPLSGYGSYVFPAVAPLIIHQTILLGLSMLILVYRERKIELNTNALIGMCLAVFTIGCLGCFYLFGFSFWLFDYPRGGNLLGMLLAVAVFIYTIIGMTCLFASFLDLRNVRGMSLYSLLFHCSFYLVRPGRMLPCPPGCKSLAKSCPLPKLCRCLFNSIRWVCLQH